MMAPVVRHFDALSVYLNVSKTLTAPTKARKLEAFKALLKGGWRGNLEALKLALKLRGENSKMRASLSPHPWFVEVFILPRAWVENRPSSFQGLIKGGELTACEPACPHRHDHPEVKSAGRCYVQAHLQIIPAVDGAVKALASGATFDTSAPYHLRLTGWGDVSRLNSEGKAYVQALLDASASHLAYTAGWRSPEMQAFRGSFMASCHTVQDALLARASGWAPFMSSESVAISGEMIKRHGFKGCPTDMKRLERPKVVGCSRCPLGCSGDLPTVITRH